MARRLSNVRLVKTFNAILARDLTKQGAELTTGESRALPVAGDEPEAKILISGLISQFGFVPFDAGGLADSWRFERARPAYCLPLAKAALRQALADADRHVLLPEGSWR